MQQRRHRKMAAVADRELIIKIDQALVAEAATTMVLVGRTAARSLKPAQAKAKEK
jgi:hypothetical protein